MNGTMTQDARATIKLQRHGNVAVVELHRPQAAHSLNQAMVAELVDATASLDGDSSVRAVLLTASGRFFCAGGDVSEMSTYGVQTAQRVKNLADGVHRAISTLARMRAPLVVAVNGVAAGGGFGLAMSGDLVLASESASFCMAYSLTGLSPDASSTYFLPRLIGLRKTQELIYTNRRLGAAEALSWGLVHKVTSDQTLHEEALVLAKAMAEGAAGSHAATKSLLAATFDHSLETQMELEGRLLSDRAASPEGQEGIRAFCEKRSPRFDAVG